jgi:hypothetical protein
MIRAGRRITGDDAWITGGDATKQQVGRRSLLVLCVFQFSARLNWMEYRGTRYTIRAGIERGQWFAVIHPEDVDVASNKILGTREDAESHARRMINSGCKTNRAQRTNKQNDNYATPTCRSWFCCSQRAVISLAQ